VVGVRGGDDQAVETLRLKQLRRLGVERRGSRTPVLQPSARVGDSGRATVTQAGDDDVVALQQASQVEPDAKSPRPTRPMRTGSLPDMRLISMLGGHWVYIQQWVSFNPPQDAS
jgi:hypothetical protein